MPTPSYIARRGELETYFDRTAVEAWARLTSNAPVGRIRATVRAGRECMRQTLSSWLPPDLSGRRILDAGCGTGALAVELANRGADVVAIDLSPNLIELARERLPQSSDRKQIEFRVGDMLDSKLGRFDHVVAMDSLIHYQTPDLVDAIGRLAERSTHSVLFTFAPRTPALAAMHAVGRLFPRANRAPAIEPVGDQALRRHIASAPPLAAWHLARHKRVIAGFYMSQAMELHRT